MFKIIDMIRLMRIKRDKKLQRDKLILLYLLYGFEIQTMFGSRKFEGKCKRKKIKKENRRKENKEK